MCGRYADANPGQTWVVTKKGFERSRQLGLEQVRRDQDRFRMNIFSDWSGYGTCELMENMVRTIRMYYSDEHSNFWLSKRR